MSRVRFGLQRMALVCYMLEKLVDALYQVGREVVLDVSSSEPDVALTVFGNAGDETYLRAHVAFFDDDDGRIIPSLQIGVRRQEGIVAWEWSQDDGWRTGAHDGQLRNLLDVEWEDGRISAETPKILEGIVDAYERAVGQQ